MKYSGHRKLLCELSKLNAFILLGYQTNTDASILIYKFRPERTGFNMYAEYTQRHLTFLTLVPIVPMMYTRSVRLRLLHKTCWVNYILGLHKTNWYRAKTGPASLYRFGSCNNNTVFSELKLTLLKSKESSLNICSILLFNPT